MQKLRDLISAHVDASEAAGAPRGRTMGALAQAAGIPESTLRNWFYCGRVAPSNERVSAVLDALGVEPGSETHREVWAEFGVAL